MADLIAPNSNDPQEMAKQVEAIAEAAAQHDEQVAQLLNLVPKAAALSTAASRAINFTKKDWEDTPTSGTPITAADMNRIEQAIVDLNTTLTSVQNSLSQTVKSASGYVGGPGFNIFASLFMVRSGGSADVTMSFNVTSPCSGSENWMAVNMTKVWSLLGVTGATMAEQRVPLTTPYESTVGDFGGLSGLLLTREGQIGRLYGDGTSYGSWSAASRLFSGPLYAYTSFHANLP